MTPPLPLWLTPFLVAACLVLALCALGYKRRADALARRLTEEQARQKSLSTVYGQISEQWFPLMPDYPYDPQFFRFLGSPVDGVQFEDDRIVFVEFKANKSRLSDRQRRLKKLVEDGYVFWEEFHFTAATAERESENNAP